MKTVYENRREKVREKLAEENLSALLVSYPTNRFYLSGFELHDGQCNESSGHILIQKNGKDILFTDSRFYEAAKTLWDENNIYIYSRQAEEIRLYLKDNVQGRTGFESKIVSHDFYENLVQGNSLEPADGIVEELRLIKDDDEVRAIKESMALNHRLFAWLPEIFREGRSEAEIAFEIEMFFRKNGATENSFPPIVAFNQHAARPHHIPASDVFLKENSHILVDVGARYKGYCSDQTRTFWFGEKKDSRFETILKQVQEAQSEAIKILAPGLPCSEAHAKAVEVFAKYGAEKAFTHSLGHGVGLDVHEEPRLSLRSKRLLKPNMIVTVEPGLYYGDYGGVRWEHVVRITEDGCEVL